MSKPFVIVTRGSALALAQAQMILDQARLAFPHHTFELKIVKTTGDRMQTASLAGSELSKGIFTKELEAALLQGEAQVAVHSLKDLPTELPDSLRLGAVTARADPRDVIIFRHIEYLAGHTETTISGDVRQRGFKPDVSLRGLPYRSVLGTSSTRRTAQIIDARPDLKVVPLRGNVGTRLRKLAEQPELDAIVLATAGLERLQVRLAPGDSLSGADVPPGLAFTRLSYAEMLPCVGQAAIGLEILSDDTVAEEICERLNHLPTSACVTAERAFLAAMGGGCHSAVGALAEANGTALRLRAVSFLGGRRKDGEETGLTSHPEVLGQTLADRLRS